MQSTTNSGVRAVIDLQMKQVETQAALPCRRLSYPKRAIAQVAFERADLLQPGFTTGRKFYDSKRILAYKRKLGCTISTRRPMAGDIQLTCSDCGQDFTFTAADQTFFQERGYSTPKRCKSCRQAKKNDQGGSGYRSAPAQGTPVICSGCGQPTTVPFEPRGDRPVFCRDCYQARKGSGGGGAGASRGRGRY
jgi:CxxC-x17-CxxC domain-containing protein